MNPIVVAAAGYNVHHRHPMMVAKEMGFFKDEGLATVDVICSDHNEDNAFIAITKGKVHFVPEARAVDVFRWVAERKVDIKIVGGYKNQNPYQARVVKGIKSFADLRGRKIGISRDPLGSTPSLFAKPTLVVLRKAGLDPTRDVVWAIDPSFNPIRRGSLDALRKGKIDVAIVDDIDGPELEAEGFPLLFSFVKDIYPHGCPDRVMITTGSMTKDQPQVIKAFLKAMIRAYRFVRDQPRNYQYMIELDKAMRAVDTDPNEKTADMKWTPEGFAVFPYPIDGRLPVKGLEAILDEEKAEGKIPQSFQIDRLLMMDLVDDANKELEGRPELREELSRVQQWVNKLGY